METPSDDTQVTLTWCATRRHTYRRTFALGQLRAQVNAERAAEGLPPVVDLRGHLGHLTAHFLGPLEDDDEQIDSDLLLRKVEAHDLPHLPYLEAYTVSVRPAGLQDGRTVRYCLYAQHIGHAKALAVRLHAQRTLTGTEVVEGLYFTFWGSPAWPADLPGAGWTDLRGDPEATERAYRLADS